MELTKVHYPENQPSQSYLLYQEKDVELGIKDQQESRPTHSSLRPSESVGIVYTLRNMAKKIIFPYLLLIRKN